VDHLFGAFASVMPAGLRDGQRAAGDRCVRLEMRSTTLADLVSAAFDPIREAGSANLPVTLRMLEVLARMASRTDAGGIRDTIVLQAELTAAMALRHVETDHDREAVSLRIARVRAAAQGRRHDSRARHGDRVGGQVLS
jgi:uncharacterized membrane protein